MARALLLRRREKEIQMAKHGEIIIPAAGAYTLHRARVPLPFLAAPPAGASPDAEGCVLLDIGIAAGGTVEAIGPAAAPPNGPTVDVEGRQVWATLMDMHAHLDKGQVIPRAVPDGTLDTGMIATAADRKRWTPEDMHARMSFGLRCAYAHGVSAIRTHLDSQPDQAPMSFAVFKALRAEWAGRVDLQAVGLVPLTFFRDDYGEALADRVAEAGAVLGGTTDAIGHYDGARNEEFVPLFEKLLRIAAARGLAVDIHTDQTEDPALFALPLIAEAVLRTRFPHSVVADHCVNLALQEQAVMDRTIARCAEAKIDFVTLPTPMVYLQDRKPGRTPRWRGVTAAQELIAAGCRVAVAGDNCRDAWFPYGDHDMVDTLQQAVRVFQLDHPLTTAVSMAGPVPADICGVPGVGRIAVGKPAKLILFAARTLNEFMCRPQADRIVLNDGRALTEGLPAHEELDAVLKVSG
jgi:cytosine deaminase